ncbi:tetratricopeptide repeat protein [Thalassoroseus pseudoceratinae]|uniref:tetratricopeptide repeat protein n=1 Tax=Thalassoroseus pseudoceratinae TaxID=2713176 RepID=UPI00141F5F6A|nr:tetratricopeptide repeat protein [Thalassoroseus pseudoceratinae]
MDFRTFSRLTTLVFILCETGGMLLAQDRQDEATPANNAARRLNEDGLIPVDGAIASVQKRLSTAPESASLQRLLGQLYMRRAKEQGDHLAYQKAEQTFRKVLKNYPKDSKASTYLATALQAQHQFKEALKIASDVAKESPKNTLAQATIGDCQLELGRYDAAEESFATLAKMTNGPSVQARLARLAELKGDTEQATELLTEALRDVQDAGGLGSLESWFEWRLGSIAFDTGRLKRASRHFRNAIAIDSSNAQAVVGLAKVQAAQGQHGEAIAAYFGAIEDFGEPPMMAALGDVYRRLGDEEEAMHWYEQAEEAMAEEAVHAAAAHYREVAMFYADRDLKPQRALELAKKDFALRQDVYGHDMLAWTLYRNGKFEEAAKSIEQALRLGTRDAKMFFHAGMIYNALGQSKRAQKAFETAIEINPHFSLLHSETAKEELAKLAPH